MFGAFLFVLATIGVIVGAVLVILATIDRIFSARRRRRRDHNSVRRDMFVNWGEFKPETFGYDSNEDTKQTDVSYFGITYSFGDHVRRERSG